MGSIDDIMQLCRLCLVKDQVNIPIFDETSDIRQTFLKINSCLPVKVSRDDNLPKKICDGCSYKLDMLYIFRNTSVDSEKQLLSWLNEAGLTSLSQAVKDGAKPEVMVKQETFETNDARIEENPEMGADAHGEISLEAQHPDMGVGAHSYIMQQQKLPYQQDFSFGEPSGSTAGLISEEPSPKRIKRAASVKKHVPLETEEEEEEELEAALQVTKAEEEDSDDVDQPDYIEAPSTSADDQPGPSGVGKGTIEAPNTEETISVVIIDDTRAPMGIKSEEVLWNDDTSFVEFQNNVVFMCEHCNEEFKHSEDLEHHLSTHDCEQKKNDNETLERRHKYKMRRKVRAQKLESCVCDVCGRVCKNKMKLYDHKKSHRRRKYLCKVCGNVFKENYQLKKHMGTHTRKDLIHICVSCQKVFDSDEQLVVHCIENDHELPSDNHRKVPERVQCNVCKQWFASKETMTLHKNAFHLGQHYVCEHCGRKFINKYYFKNHVKAHDPNYIKKKYPCQFCSKVLFTKKHYELHTQAHTGDKQSHLCDICGKKFTSRDGVLVHKHNIHEENKPLICDVCGKGFSLGKLLTAHKKIHSKKKPHVCEICHKAFSMERYLINHVRVHTKEKPFTCKTCGKAFTQNSSLHTHMRYHTGERPYKCVFCHRGFVTKSFLKRHTCNT